MATVTLKPKKGLTVRNPKTLKPLGKDGTRVEMNAYWQRRLRDGDVVIVEDKVAQFAPTSNQKHDKTKSKGTRR